MAHLAGSTHSFAELPLEEALEEVLSLGLSSVEISHRRDVQRETWEGVRGLLESREAVVVSLALEESASPDEIQQAFELAASLNASFLVVGAPPAGAAAPSEKEWQEEASATVSNFLELASGAGGSAVTPALEIPRRETLAGDLDSYREFSRLLVRHRIPLSVDTNEVAHASLSVNELWRYFASRIAHVRLGSPPGDERVDLEQWARMAYAYGYPGVWVLRPELEGIALDERRGVLADYRSAAEVALGKYAEPAATK